MRNDELAVRGAVMRDVTVTESFERYEFKYWAPLKRLESGMKLLQDVMQEDEVALRAGASQLNTSLYFDSPHFLLLERHLSGSPDRIKLRTRYYGEHPSGDCFFEIKRRQGVVVTKRRAVLSLGEAEKLVHDISGPLPVANEALEAFQYLAVRCAARPALLVRARRQAFRATDPAVDVRLTIDRDIAWQPTRAPHYLVADERHWRSIEGGDDGQPRALVEVKFHSARPWWLGHFAEHLAPWRVSFSKYVAAALQARSDPFFTMDAA